MQEKLNVPRSKSPEHQERASIEALEESFYRDVSQMRSHGTDVGELAERWVSRHDTLHDSNAPETDLREFYNEFETFKERRVHALASIEVTEGIEKEAVQQMFDFDKSVTGSFRMPSLFQGNGGTAEVYEVLGHPQICVKFITNQAQYNENNHIRAEFAFLREMNGVRVGSARTPAPYFLRIHPRDGHSYGMERVRGKNLSRVMENPSECHEILDIARQCDKEKTISDFLGLVREMHTRGISHNDMYLRNMMLDTDGSIFLIDFGKAKHKEGDDAFEERCKSEYNHAEGELRRFFESIDKINV